MGRFEEDLHALRTAIARGARLDDIDNVVPVVIPRAFVARPVWPGPFVLLRHSELALTWAVLTPGETMMYVSHERAATWDKDGTDWRSRALANLRSRSGHPLWTHERPSPTGGFVFVAMMHADGLGSSRGLLAEALSQQLGGSLRIGMPDRSCCIVFQAEVRDIDGREPARMVREMFEGATSPLCGDLLEVEDLAPEQESG